MERASSACNALGSLQFAPRDRATPKNLCCGRSPAEFRELRRTECIGRSAPSAGAGVPRAYLEAPGAVPCSMPIDRLAEAPARTPSTVPARRRHAGLVSASIPVGSLRGKPAPRTTECECPSRGESPPPTGFHKLPRVTFMISTRFEGLGDSTTSAACGVVR